MRRSEPHPTDGNRPGARRTRIALAVSMVLGLSVFSAAQSLAESARKEQERREILKKSGAVVVTTADLAKVKKRPSVTNPGEAAPPENPASTSAALGPGNDPAISTGQGAPARTAEIASSALEGNPKDVFDRKRADIERRWNAARERLSLLEVKLLALRQDFGNSINADARERAGKDLDALTPILAAAQLEEKNAKFELDKFLTGPSAQRK